MFDGFERRVRQNSDLGPQPQEGQQIVDRALQLGALSPATARSRADLDIRHDPNWSQIIACGYLREADAGRYYLARSDGSADHPTKIALPFSRVALVTIVGLAFMFLILRRVGLL